MSPPGSSERLELALAERGGQGHAGGHQRGDQPGLSKGQEVRLVHRAEYHERSLGQPAAGEGLRIGRVGGGEAVDHHHGAGSPPGTSAAAGPDPRESRTSAEYRLTELIQTKPKWFRRIERPEPAHQVARVRP